MSDTSKIGYLAPLNYDRYFKKVFSDLKIAKRFLEDFLDIKIQAIEMKPNETYLTDDARYVQFDFRCKVDGSFMIIEMQQWYKPDIVQRFYLYDSLNTGLQLEELPVKTIDLPDNKVKEIKDYRSLLPTVTLIWLVDDNLNMKDDYVSIVPSPEDLLTFIRDVNIWRQPDLDELVEKRESLLTLIDNKTKDLNFLQNNRLIFAFQKNIVKNKRYKKYYAWFELAQKTLRRVSDKLEYLEYEKDKILAEVVRRLKKQIENPDEIKYIEEHTDYIERIKRYEEGVQHYANIEVEEERKQAESKLIKSEEKRKREEEKRKREEEKRKLAEEERKQEEEKRKLAEAREKRANLKAKIYELLFNGKSKEEISQILKINFDEIDKILE